jgi:hypothetical protein
MLPVETPSFQISDDSLRIRICLDMSGLGTREQMLCE